MQPFKTLDIISCWDQVSPKFVDGQCWLWQGEIFAGHGRYKNMFVERFVYLHENFYELKSNYWIYQSCGNALCVNPAHLFASSTLPPDVRYIQHGDFTEAGIKLYKSKIWYPEDPTDCFAWKSESNDIAATLIRNVTGRRINYGRYSGMGAHVYGYILAKGPIPPDLFVCHHCDYKPCCNVAHHFLGTHQDNMDDLKRKNQARKPQGLKKSSKQAREKAKMKAKYAVDKALWRLLPPRNKVE